jgi:type IV secretory pathway VirD2 relaxase
MSNDDDFFELLIGRPRTDTARSGSGRLGQVLSFERQVMHGIARAGGDPRRINAKRLRSGKAQAKSGRFNARGRGAKIVKTFTRDSGWKFDANSGTRMRARRVVVKARVVKLRGPQSRAAYTHLRYLQRDGVSREGEPGRLYGPVLDNADGGKFLDRCEDDRHQFRFIVAPEDGVELGDLQHFTRETMEQMERDLDTQLDWVAVDHHNTGHPHSHVVLRGVTDDGKTLNIAGDYIAYGIRHRASEILTRDLGLQSEREVQEQLSLEVNQDRFTRLDRALIEQAGAEARIDMRQDPDEDYLGDANRYRLLQRLKKLERLGLAEETEAGSWSLAPDMEKTLRAMGERGDIIKTMHRALTEGNLARSADQYVVHHGPEVERTTIGRVISKGLSADEMADRIHVVVDGLDGRVHYAELSAANAGDVNVGNIVEVGQALVKPRESDRNIAAFARDNGGTYEPVIHLSIAREKVQVPGNDHEGYVLAHVRRLEALRRAGIVERLEANTWRIPQDFEARAREYDTQKTKQLGVRVLSVLDLGPQVRANAATWLDRELVAKTPAPTVDSGFGREVQNALTRRRQWLIERDLAQGGSDGTRYHANLLTILARREVEERGGKIARERGGSFHMPEDGERVTGRYREAVHLTSNKYALIERARDFTLVPWRPVIEKDLGRTVSGLVRGSSISWELGRSRGIGIGM